MSRQLETIWAAARASAATFTGLWGKDPEEFCRETWELEKSRVGLDAEESRDPAAYGEFRREFLAETRRLH